jgi:hypothetical protein
VWKADCGCRPLKRDPWCLQSIPPELRLLLGPCEGQELAAAMTYTRNLPGMNIRRLLQLLNVDCLNRTVRFAHYWLGSIVVRAKALVRLMNTINGTFRQARYQRLEAAAVASLMLQYNVCFRAQLVENPAPVADASQIEVDEEGPVL